MKLWDRDGGFLHAKCFLFYSDGPNPQQALFDRFRPVLAIVGSSNPKMLSAATDHTAQVINRDQRALGAANDRIRITIQAVSKLTAMSIR